LIPATFGKGALIDPPLGGRSVRERGVCDH
jgi:hypothetical protein